MKVAFLCTFLVTTISFAQKEANIWYFGKNAGLDFTNGIPTVLLNGVMNTNEGCATISDSNGNLLFYTDGVTIWNRNHVMMLNGSGLLGDNSSTHSAIIVPKPSDNNIYYIFTVGSSGTGSLSYSELDMNLDGGLGAITSNKNIILFTPVNEKITAIQKEGSDGYWVVSHKHNSDEFLTYEVSSSGVNINPTVTAVGSNTGFFNITGQIKISPDNSKLAVARGGEVQLFDFDNSTGVISNPQTLDNGAVNSYGTEFSQNGNLLYIAFFGGVYQYNLLAGTTTDIISSKVTLVSVSNEGFASLQLAPDGKIYVARQDKLYIDYISNPNVIGIGCDYNYEGLFLNGRESRLGLPTFIQSFFRTTILYENTCFGDLTSFSLSNQPDSVTWDFGDPSSGSDNTSVLLNPSHTFTSPGIYTVTATMISETEVITETEEIVIYEVPIATQPANIIACDDNNDGFFSFDLTSQDIIILNGQDSSVFTVTYFASQEDFDNNIPISDPNNYDNISAYIAQTILASVQNNGNIECLTTTTFEIQVFESPTPSLDVPVLSYCDNTTVGSDVDGRIEFDLTQNAAVILNGQLSSDFSINYFTDSGLSNQIINPSTYQNTNRNETIYIEVVNNQNTNCTAQTSFDIEVLELPEVTSVVELKQCDDNLDGFSVFNLTEVNAELTTNYQDETITFYESQSDAESGLTPITNTNTYVNQNVSTDVVWARIENANFCYRVAQVNLTVSTTQIPSSLLREFYQCDDGADISDGISTFDFSSVNTEIQSLFPTGQQLIINYYRNQADALSETDPITDISNYQNIGYPQLQEIYVRVDSELDNDCLGLGHHITLHVETLPVAHTVTIPEQCDTDRDGIYAFDTSDIDTSIFNGQIGMSVTYTDGNGNVLPSPLPNPFVTDSQTITARVENIISQDPDGACYDETTIEFIVINVPVANQVSILQQCDDNFDGIVDFDTSTIESTLLGTQTAMVVEYTDQNGQPLPSPLPNPFTVGTQTITARVLNPEFSGCFDETTIDFSVYEKPEVELEETGVICITEVSQLELFVQNPRADYSYQWTNESGMVISSDESATIMEGGIYTVVATSQFGCMSDPKEITITESEIATVDDNQMILVDDSNNNSITINTSGLGIGDYEFSLLDEQLSTLVDFQDNPFFDNLDGGIYTVLIRDKNGCGVFSKELSLITFPKFFTPNNDGINDTWNVKGYNRNLFQNGKVEIFNRFGKRVSLFTLDSEGWDGLYNGNILPSGGYWFHVQIVSLNGIVRSKKGHFSLLRR